MNQAGIALLVAINFGSAAVFAQVPPNELLTLRGLRLPDRARVVIEHQPPAGVAQFDRLTVYETLEEAWGIQDRFEGSVGAVPADLTLSNKSETLIYDIRARRGMRSDRFATSGTTRLDGLATPLGWVRRAQRVLARGGSAIAKPAEDGELRISVEPIERTERGFVCIVHEASGQLREVHTGDPDRPSRYVYTDWRDVKPGVQLPWIIEYHDPGDSNRPPFNKVSMVKSALVGPEAGVVPGVVLAPDAVIEDRLKGRMVRGDGAPSDAPLPTITPPRTSWWSRNDLLLVGSGVLLLVSAAVIVRRKGRHA